MSDCSIISIIKSKGARYADKKFNNQTKKRWKNYN